MPQYQPYQPSETKILEAIHSIKLNNPEFGLNSVTKELKKLHHNWVLGEKRVSKYFKKYKEMSSSGNYPNDYTKQDTFQMKENYNNRGDNQLDEQEDKIDPDGFVKDSFYRSSEENNQIEETVDNNGASKHISSSEAELDNYLKNDMVRSIIASQEKDTPEVVSPVNTNDEEMLQSMQEVAPSENVILKSDALSGTKNLQSHNGNLIEKSIRLHESSGENFYINPLPRNASTPKSQTLIDSDASSRGTCGCTIL